MLGRTLRQYVITGHLGHGGVGEVWLARDQTLDRDVALKVLPTRDGDAVARKERFFREAKAASALNPPSIITIYEINSDQGIDFIAMELVRGRTLGSLLQQGPLGIDQIVRYATQIAEAVGRTHRAGIVHRDLKPGNIRRPRRERRRFRVTTRSTRTLRGRAARIGPPPTGRVSDDSSAPIPQPPVSCPE